MLPFRLMLPFRQSSARSHANKKPRPTHTRDLPDTQREIIPSRIPSQCSGGDRRLPDLRLPDLRDALQALFSVTQNGCTGGTLPGTARPRTPAAFFFWST